MLVSSDIYVGVALLAIETVHKLERKNCKPLSKHRSHRAQALLGRPSI
jgi:hypothetical protein